MFGCETCLVTLSELRVFGMPRNPRKKERLENFGEPRASAAKEFSDILEIGKHIKGAKSRGHLTGVIGD